MEGYGFEKNPRTKKVRMPPRRGQIKVEIFKKLVKKLKSSLSVYGITKKKVSATAAGNLDS